MIQSACPDRDRLLDYVVGRIPDRELESVAEHIDVCDDCGRTARELDQTDDQFIRSVREVEGQSYLHEKQLRVAMQRVQAIGIPPVERSGPATQSQRQLGPYRLLNSLGCGGMGSVFKATHTRLGKTVAVKILRTKRALQQQAMARFEREMQAVGKLQHPNIVQASDAGEVNGQQFLVMEYLQGEDLNALLDRHGSLSISSACEIVRQAALGLHHAHENGLVHRDLKPSNLMLTESGQVKLLDLGLARFDRDLPLDVQGEAETRAQYDSLTCAGNIMGTAEFIAPEQIADCRQVDRRADIYSLGCTLFTLLTGEPPFRRDDHPSAQQMLVARQTTGVRDIRESRADIPRALAQLISRMTATNVNDRPHSAAAVAESLREFCNGDDLTELFGDRPNQRPSAKPNIHRDQRRWTWIFGVTLLLAVLGLAAAPAIITLTTPDGTIIVETHDKNIQVSVMRNGKEVDIIDARSGWRILIRAGKYDVKLRGTNTNFTLSQNSVTVKRGKRITVRLKLIPKKQPSPKRVTAGSPFPLPGRPPSLADALLAEKALAKSGATFARQDIRYQGSIKKGAIVGVTLANLSVKNHVLQPLPHLPHLTSLTIIGCPNITNDGFAVLATLARLQSLNLSPSNITDDGLRHLAHLKRLSILGLNGTGITKKGLAHIANLAGLEVLYLQDTRVDDEAMKSLRLMTSMRWLNLTGTLVTSRGIPSLAKMRDLRILHLNQTRVGDAAVEVLVGLKNLETLGLNRTGITDRAIPSLLRMRNLKHLQISSTRISLAGLSRLRKGLPACQIEFGTGTPASRGLPLILPGSRSLSPPPHRRSLRKPTDLKLFLGVTCVKFLQEEDRVITGDLDGALRVWSFSSGQHKYTLRTQLPFVRDLAVSADGKYVAACGPTANIELWNMKSGKMERLLTGHEANVTSADFSPDGKFLVSGAIDGAVITFDLTNKLPSGKVRPFRKHPKPVNCVRYSPDGKVLVGISGTTIMRSTDSIRYVSQTSAIGHVAFAPDSRTLVYDAGPAIGVMDVLSFKSDRINSGHKARVRVVEASPTGLLIASGDANGEVRLWNWKTHKVARVYQAHGTMVTKLTFSPDGTQLISLAAGTESKPRIWKTGDYSYYGNAAKLSQWAHENLPTPANIDIKMSNRVAHAVQLGGGDIKDAAIELLENLTSLRTVQLTYTYGCSANSLVHLRKLKNVTKLNLWGNYNFSSGVRNLSGLTNIEDLTLHKIRVTSEDMVFLARMKRCKRFHMTLNHVVQDEGLKHLANLTELEDVYLTCPQLTDNCLRYFAGLKKLKRLTISSPKINRAALMELAKTLPKLKVLNNEAFRAKP